MNTKICSFNVKGLGSVEKRQHIMNWLKGNEYNICFLQELHCKSSEKEKWQRDWGSDLYISGNSSSNTGVGILLNGNFKVIEYVELIIGRLQCLTLVINDFEVTLINVYGFNTDDDTLLTKLEQYLTNNDERSYIIGGDFNIVLDIHADKKNGTNRTHSNCHAKIINIINNFELLDIWRVLNPESRQYTWHSNHKPPIFCRLDYFLISPSIANKIINCKITAGLRSDHSLVYFKAHFSNDEHGSGYFKLNNSVLLDDQYQKNIRNAIKETVENNKDANPNVLWELIKGSIRNVSIKYCANKKKEMKNDENEITREIDNLKLKQIDRPDDLTIINKLKEKTEQLESITKLKARGHFIRAKAIYIEGFEKNTKYFASLEKKRIESKTISQLKVNENVITSKNDIMNETKLFYKKLYARQKVSNSNIAYFPPNNVTINHVQRESCEGPIKEDEAIKALKDMKNNKSPGSDGITTEFYKIFWKDIKAFYINSINYSHQHGNLTELQRQGIVNLIPKKDKDLADLNNWRPLVLLNNDYKLATKTIANRIKPILATIKSRSQTGFLKDRYIGENIRQIYDIIDHLNDLNKPGMILFADFEKAFDSLDHTFMLNVIDYFGFGKSLKQWINVFYSNITGIISNNGFLSESFDICRGVRQGCPLSPYLFIMAIEILSMKVSQNDDIKGIVINHIEVKSSLFADDATFFQDGTEKSFKSLVDTIESFSLMSGLKLNPKNLQLSEPGPLGTLSRYFVK